jgi:hypothetical protein
MRLLFTSFAGAAAVIAMSALSPPPASAERVCHQECGAGICKEQCIETTERERDRVIIEGRGERRDERREEKREPGVELKVPGVGVEIGR